METRLLLGFVGLLLPLAVVGCVPPEAPADATDQRDAGMPTDGPMDSARETGETGEPPDTPMERDLPRDVPEGHDMDAGPTCDAICVPCCEEGSGEYVGCATCTWQGNQCSEGTYWCRRDGGGPGVDAEAGSG